MSVHSGNAAKKLPYPIQAGQPIIRATELLIAPDGHAAAGSPALALQSQLHNAVLQGWAAPRVDDMPKFTRSQALSIIGYAIAAWVGVFGAGWLLVA